MPRKRNRRPKLPKLLDNSPDVVAVVDSDFEIIYANPACCEWLNIAQEELQGIQLKYSLNQTSATHNPASGLCPDPICFDDDFLSAQGQIASLDGLHPVWIPATFTAFRGETDDTQFVLVVGHGANIPNRHDNEIPLHVQINDIAHRLQLQQNSRHALDQLMGKSDFAQLLKRKIAAISENEADCLVVGPPGSGREHVARTIFAARQHESANLVPILCAIADSQFIQDSIKEWVFDQREHQSNDWLLLLDVDKMQADAQMELFGYTQLPNFPMRILATSEFDLRDRAEQGEFHAGLAMQLSVQIIELLPLAKRKTDLSAMTQFFVESYNQHSDLQISGVTDEVLELFYEYEWPNNLDELRQCIKEAHGNCNHVQIAHNDLPDSFLHALSAARIGRHHVEKIELDRFLEDIERELILRALSAAGNNKTRAAELLGINRAKLLRRANSLKLLEDSSDDNDQQIDSSAFKEAEN